MAFVSIVVVVWVDEAFSANADATGMNVQILDLVREPLAISGESVQVSGEWTVRDRRPGVPANSVWVHKGRVKSKYKLAGRDGELVADIKKWRGRTTRQGVKYWREVFVYSCIKPGWWYVLYLRLPQLGCVVALVAVGPHGLNSGKDVLCARKRLWLSWSLLSLVL